MRILYLSAETPATPAGGIATYLQYMVPAMQAAGHEVFLFTWPKDAAQQVVLENSPFKPENTWFCRDVDSGARAHYPNGTLNHAVAYYLLPSLLRCVQEWRIDVIEATDFMGPAFFLYQQLRSTRAGHARLCATYYHGFIEDFFEADYLRAPKERLRDLAVERQQCRISDLVIAPSQAAARRLVEHGIATPVNVVREPYRFGEARHPASLQPAITYMGRLSLSKGIDAIVYLANAIEEGFALRRLLLVGNEVPTPFKVMKLQDYVRGRLCPSLREKVQFAGFLPRAQALALLNPGEIAPHLGYADTF
ncbi:MAG: glycosyltransferase, partial [Gammaproteobacteria bacterium]